MGQVNYTLPTVGEPVSTEDPLVRTALVDLKATINALDNANIATAANINASKLADTSIQTDKLANDAVTADKLRDDASTDANRAVTTNHLRDDAVTADKLRDDASTDANRAVTTNHIRDAAVTTAKVADDAVTAAKLNIPTTTATLSTGVGPTVAGTYAKASGLTVNLAPGIYLICGALQTFAPDGNYVEVEIRQATTVIATGRVETAGTGDRKASMSLIAVATITGTTNVDIDTYVRSNNTQSFLNANSRVVALPIG